MILEVAASEFVDFEIGLIFNRAGGEDGKQSEEGFKKKKERGKNRNGSVHRYNSPIIARFLPPPHLSFSFPPNPRRKQLLGPSS